MADAVETMAYVGEKPWHGLGVEVPPGITPDEMLVLAGLDWEVRKQKMWTFRPDNPKAPLLVDNFFALVREPQHDTLGICGSGYTPFQNREIFAFFNKYCKAGNLELETAGSLAHGKWVWGLAKVNGFDMGDDKTDGYLLLASPHIWGKAMTVMYTAVRVVCMNTIQLALNSASDGKVHVPHMKAFDSELIESVGQAIGLADDCMQDYKDKVLFLAKVKAERDQQLRYVAELMQPSLLEQSVISHVNFKKPASMVFEAIANSPGSTMKIGKYKVNETWYGALNGATFVLDHRRGKDPDTALQSAWLGKDAGLKRKALDLAVKYAKAA